MTDELPHPERRTRSERLARILRLIRLMTSDRAQLRSRSMVRWLMLYYGALNKFSRRRVTGSASAVVNLTTYGHRIDYVHLAIESIVAGRSRPRRMILWLDEDEILAHPPAAIRRLIERGLEVLPCDDFGPHKKQYAFALTDDRSGLPLVAADDDVFYPRNWLGSLVDANIAHPDVLNGLRAHNIATAGEVVLPYREWTPRAGTDASFAVMCTGVSGVIYPPELISALRSEGEAFRQAAPFADDVWVSAVAVRHGFRARQVGVSQAEFLAIAGTQRGTLYRRNVREGGNDLQIAASFGAAEVARIREDEQRGV